MVLIICRMVPSGLSWRNSKAAVSFSIKEILMKRSARVLRQSNIKSRLLSTANNDLVSLSLEGGEFTNLFARLEFYDGFRQI